MAKPHVVKNSKTVTLKRDGKPKTYVSYSLRITAWDKETQGVKQRHLKTLGLKPVMTESEAKAVVDEYGEQFGFELEDLQQVRRLTIVKNEEANNGGEKAPQG